MPKRSTLGLFWKGGAERRDEREGEGQREGVGGGSRCFLHLTLCCLISGCAVYCTVVFRTLALLLSFPEDVLLYASRRRSSHG